MPVYKAPLRPQDPVIEQAGTRNFLYLRDNFYGAGQDSYTKPFAQNQELFASLRNLMPITDGVCRMRYGYELFNNLGSAAGHLYSYQNLNAGLRKLVYSTNAGISVSNEDGTSISSIITSTTANPRVVVSRDYLLAPQTQTSNLAATINPHGDGQKWNSTEGTTNLGIANGPSAPVTAGPDSPAAAADGAEGHTAWTNPNNILVADGVFATNTIVHGGAASINSLQGTNFGFALPTSAVITGIKIEVKGMATATGSGPAALPVQLMKTGVAVGNTQFITFDGTNQYQTLGDSSDLWGVAWNPGDINAANFGVFMGNLITIGGSGTDSYSIDHYRVTVFYLGGIVITSTAGAGAITLASGRVYAASYRNSISGHWSDISGFSASTGVLAAKQVVITVPYHGDTQVDLIAILATLDGGDETTLYVVNYIPNLSGSAGSNATYTDNTPDTTLVTNNIASEVDDFGTIHGAQDNSVLIDGLTFPAKYRGRIWAALETALYFSKSLDEVTTSTGLVAGRYEEAWPATNSMDVSTQRESIRGLLTDGDVLYVGTERHIWRLSGDSPSNFSKPEIVFNEVGILNQDVWQIVFAEGRPLGMLWITPDRRVIMSNFGNYEDIGTPIQDILDTLNISAGSAAWGGFFSEGAFDIYILAIPTGSNTVADTFCVLDLRSQRWSIWTPTDQFLAGLFNIDATGTPQWLVSTSSGKNYRFRSSATQDRVADTPINITPNIQTPWMHLGSPTMIKSLNEIEVITDDTAMTITIQGASTFAQTSSPNTVVTSAALVNSPRGFKKLYLAGDVAKDRFYRFTFTGTGNVQNVLEGFTIEAVPILY